MLIALVVVIFLLVVLNALQVWFNHRIVSELTLKIMAGDATKYVTINRAQQERERKMMGGAPTPEVDPNLVDLQDANPDDVIAALGGAPEQER